MPWGSVAAELLAVKGMLGSAKGTGAPGTLYVALLQATAGDEDTALGTEPDSTGGYVRVALDNVDASWTFATAGASNTAEIRWPAATGLWSITSALNQLALFDNSAGGTCIAFGKLDPTITITGAGDEAVIAAGGLVLTQAA